MKLVSKENLTVASQERKPNSTRVSRIPEGKETIRPDVPKHQAQLFYRKFDVAINRSSHLHLPHLRRNKAVWPERVRWKKSPSGITLNSPNYRSFLSGKISWHLMWAWENCCIPTIDFIYYHMFHSLESSLKSLASLSCKDFESSMNENIQTHLFRWTYLSTPSRPFSWPYCHLRRKYLNEFQDDSNPAAEQCNHVPVIDIIAWSGQTHTSSVLHDMTNKFSNKVDRV